MEIKINKEIRSFSESVIMGLNLRQFICSVFAVIASVIIYFVMSGSASHQTVSYVIILACAPPAFLGFFRYHGMSAERAALAFIRDTFIEPRHVFFEGRNIYLDILREKSV